MSEPPSQYSILAAATLSSEHFANDAEATRPPMISTRNLCFSCSSRAIFTSAVAASMRAGFQSLPSLADTTIRFVIECTSVACHADDDPFCRCSGRQTQPDEHTALTNDTNPV